MEQNERMKPILLTFSEKNKDVYNLINDRNKEEFKQNTDYICNAIRFYENYKNKFDNSDINNIDEDKIEEILIKLLKKHSVNINESDLAITTKDIKSNLEDNLEEVDCEED